MTVTSRRNVLRVALGSLLVPAAWMKGTVSAWATSPPANWLNRRTSSQREATEPEIATLLKLATNQLAIDGIFPTEHALENVFATVSKTPSGANHFRLAFALSETTVVLFVMESFNELSAPVRDRTRSAIQLIGIQGKEAVFLDYEEYSRQVKKGGISETSTLRTIERSGCCTPPGGPLGQCCRFDWGLLADCCMNCAWVFVMPWLGVACVVVQCGWYCYYRSCREYYKIC